MKVKGNLIDWNDEKGFGFVEPIGGGDKAFVHIKAFDGYSARPSEGDLIVYEKQIEADGRFKAINVVLANDRKRRIKARNKNGGSGSIVVLGLTVILFTLIYVGRLPLLIGFWATGLSVISFIAYAVDKSAAQNNKWRTKESTLHMLSLLGGWLGAYAAQKILRHKSTKKEFRVGYWFTVFVNFSVLMWLASDDGQMYLRSILH